MKEEDIEEMKEEQIKIEIIKLFMKNALKSKKYRT